MKSGIYALEQPAPRAELCKDVAAMAYAQGGLLLIGLQTQAADGREIVSERVSDWSDTRTTCPINSTAISQQTAASTTLLPDGGEVQETATDGAGQPPVAAWLERVSPGEPRCAAATTGRRHRLSGLPRRAPRALLRWSRPGRVPRSRARSCPGRSSRAS